MKNLFKKVSALLMAAIMVLSMCTAVFAETKNTATITVTGAEGAKLEYAQVIKADQKTRTGWNFVDDNVAEAYKTAFGLTDAQAVIEAMTAGNVDASKLGLAQAKAANKVTFADFTDMENSQTTVTAAGVYLVKATEEGFTYNLMSAYVGFGKVIIGEKEYEYPSLVDPKAIQAKKTPINVGKEVTDGDDNKDNVVANGDTLTYTVKTNVPFIAPTDTDKTFWVKDELTGAEYIKTEKVTIALGGVDVTNDVDGTNAKLYPITWGTEKEEFSVDLSKMINDANSNAGKPVVITYKVKVTSENDAITNTATAGHQGDAEFGSKTKEVYQGNITLTKTGEAGVTLPNAGFEVRKDDGESALKFTKLGEGTGVYKYDPAGDVTEVFTNADGKVEVKGLDVGTYHFKEITAPEGYSVNQTPVDATLEVTDKVKGADGKVNKVLTAETSMTDTKLSALPSTGGMGTYLFTIIGVVVMAGAAGAFFISRRKGSEE